MPPFVPSLAARGRTACLALLLVAPAAGAQAAPDPALARRIEAVLGRPEFRHALWGIAIRDRATNAVLYELNADKLFTPGSTTKLLTAATALEVLGADHRSRTRVLRTGPVTPDGTLRGDLVLVASGDPNLSQRLQPDGTLAFEDHDHSYGGAPDTRAVPGDPLVVLRQLAAQVRARGIRRVTGQVRVDASLFPEGTRELGTGVVVSPVSLNDNVIDLTVGPGATVGAPLAVRASPVTGYVRVVNRTRTVPADSASSLAFSDATDADGRVTLTVTGGVPAGTAPVLHAYPVPSPSRFAAVAFAEALAAAGVALPAGRRAPAAPTDLAPFQAERFTVAEHQSAPATEMIKVILKVSQNVHASSLPPLLAALRGGPGRTGFDLEREWLQRAGLDTRGAQQGDGAGGDAHFTPAFMVDFLRMMGTRPDFPAFRAALPVLGRDGTLYDIQRDSPAAGHVAAKTGTYAVDDPLNRLLLVTGKGLAGYATTRSGRELVLCIYVNNVAVGTGPDEVKRVVGQALGEVAAATWEVE